MKKIYTRKYHTGENFLERRLVFEEKTSSYEITMDEVGKNIEEENVLGKECSIKTPDNFVKAVNDIINNAKEENKGKIKNYILDALKPSECEKNNYDTNNNSKVDELSGFIDDLKVYITSLLSVDAVSTIDFKSGEESVSTSSEKYSTTNLSDYFKKRGEALLDESELLKKIEYTVNSSKTLEEQVKEIQTAMNIYAEKNKLDLSPHESGGINVIETDGKAGRRTVIAKMIINGETIPDFVKTAKETKLSENLSYLYTGEGKDKFQHNAVELMEMLEKNTDLARKIDINNDDFKELKDEEKHKFPGIKTGGIKAVWKFQNYINNNAKDIIQENKVKKARGPEGKLATDGLLGDNTNALIAKYEGWSKE